MMNLSLFTQVLSSRLWANLAITGALVTGGICAGIVPTVSSAKSGFDFNGAAYAQATNQQQITQYAQAALKIEQKRQRAYAEAKRIMGGNVPTDVCRQSNIPQDVRTICTAFLKESKDIILESGLTVTQFNEITRLRQSDPQVKQQIQSALVKIQQGNP